MQSEHLYEHLYADTGCRLLNERDADIEWTAQWIGPRGEHHPNSYFLARRRFEVGSVPAHAILRIAADARYAAYMNGQFVGNGPARGTHRRYFADSFDVTPLLQEGENWIAVEVYCCLAPCYVMAPLQPALLAEIQDVVATDSSWQVRRDPSHRTDAAIYTGQIGFSEWRDMRAEPQGWMTGNGAADAWQAAEEAGLPGDFGGRITVLRPIADLERTVVLPVSVAGHGCVPDAGDGAGTADYAELMSRELHVPPRRPNVADPAALVRPSGVTTLSPADDGAGTYLILDFDREVFGNLVFDIEAPAGAVMDVGHDDTLEHGRLVAQKGKYCFADRFVLREGRQVISQHLHNRGFRYIQIVLRGFQQPLRLHSVKAISRTYSQEATATCATHDPFLTKLWQACVNTVRLCASDTFMDCPWREQALWTNDQAVTSLLYLAMTGDPVFAAHNLRVSADGAQPNGLIPPVYPSQRTVLFPNLPSLWTFTLYDYYWYTGDRDTLQELLPVMEKGLSVYDGWRDEDDLVPDQEGAWNFIDWGYQGVPLHGKTAALNMLIAAAYKRAACLESAAANEDAARTYSTRSREAVAAVDAAFWDTSKGRYRDCTAPEGEPTYSQHPPGIGLYFDLLEEPRRSAALAHLLDPDLVWCELYFQHFVLGALARNGRVPEALSVIRQLWGQMIQEDSSTVWESYRGRSAFHACGSLCHAFACTPLHFLQAHVLGVQPLRPGFAEFSINPHLADLGTASGHVPTPHGRVFVRARQLTEDRLDVDLTVPAGTRARTPDGRTWGAGRHTLEI